MITIDGKTLRNLEEQVLKNKEDIEDITSISGLLGIKVVGVVSDEDPLPSEDSDVFAALDYGDAYIQDNAEGEEEATDYVFYIKSRPNVSKNYDHWFDLRLTGIQGPQGIQGVQGIQGIDGTYWTFGNTQPANPRVSDLYVNTNGDVYMWNGGAWVNRGSIKGPRGTQGPIGSTGMTGPQGPQGPQGERGDPGAFIHIAGKLATAELLPDPAVIKDLSKAYLVRQFASEPPVYELYVQVGEDYETAQWDNIGILNVATYVTVGGEFVGQFDADTKLDKVTSSGAYMRAYCITTAGVQQVQNVDNKATPNSICRRDSVGNIKVSAPGNDADAVPKSYVEGKLPEVVRLG